MKRGLSAGWVFALAMALGLLAPVIGWAAEHGGKKEHGWAPAVAAQEHGGATPAGMDEASLLLEAADALRDGQIRPDLADQLEAMAEAHSAAGE